MFDEEDGVELVVGGALVEEGSMGVFGPASGLTPDGYSLEIGGFSDFFPVFFVFVSDEIGDGAEAFSFASGLEFDDFGYVVLEDEGGNFAVAIEVAFSVFERYDEVGRGDVLEYLVEGAIVPDEVSDLVDSDGPGAKDSVFVVGFEDGNNFL